MVSGSELVDDAVAAINNDTVFRLIHNGGNSSRVDTVTMCLSELQRAMEMIQVGSSSSTSGSVATTASLRSGSSLVQWSHMLESALVDPGGQHILELQNHHGGYVYNRPLRLVPTNQQCEGDNSVDCCINQRWMILSVTLIYNAALAWHLLAELTGRDAAYDKASRMYEVLIMLLDDHNDVADDNSDNNVDGYNSNVNDIGHSSTTSSSSSWSAAAVSVLYCVVLNNLAQIYYKMGNYHEFYECQMQLYHLLFSSDVVVDALEVYMGADDTSNIQFNLHCMTTPQTALAA